MALNITVGPSDRAVLEGWLRSPSISAGLAQRARIVLLLGSSPADEVAPSTGCPVSTSGRITRRSGSAASGFPRQADLS